MFETRTRQEQSATKEFIANLMNTDVKVPGKRDGRVV
jgi:hypothetical protein